MANSNFHGYQNSPIRIMKNSKTCIDVVFCKNEELISSTEVLACPFSDHDFVVVELNLKPIKKAQLFLNLLLLIKQNWIKLTRKIILIRIKFSNF